MQTDIVAGLDGQGVGNVRSNVDHAQLVVFVHLVPAKSARSNGDGDGGDDCSGAFVQHLFSQFGSTSSGWCPRMLSSVAPLVSGTEALVAGRTKGGDVGYSARPLGDDRLSGKAFDQTVVWRYVLPIHQAVHQNEGANDS